MSKQTKKPTVGTAEIDITPPPRKPSPARIAHEKEKAKAAAEAAKKKGG